MPITLRVYRATRFDTFYLLTLIMLSVGAQLATGDLSVAVTSSVPLWEAYLSMSLLLLSTFVTLVGVAWRGTNLAALQIEQVGRAMLAFPALGYGAALLYYGHFTAGVSAALLIWLSVSCVLRFYEIRKALAGHYQAMVQREEEGEGGR